MIAARDRQDGPACIASAQKSPKAKVGVGEAGPLLVCTCQSGNRRRDPTVSTANAESVDMDWACWGCLSGCNQPV